MDKEISEIKKEKDELINKIETLVNEFLSKNNDVAIDINIYTTTIDTRSRCGNQTVIGGIKIQSTLKLI